MLTDIKALLETTGYKVALVSFIKPPALPYLIVTEQNSTGGADYKNCLVNRQIGVELYSAKIDQTAEQIVENLLNEKSIEFKKDRIWIDTDSFFQTKYDFILCEKM